MIQNLANPYFLLAFVVAPLVVLAFGWCIVLVHERSLDKEQPKAGE